MEQSDLERQLEELHRRRRAESRRQLDELVARSKFKNGAEMLQAFRDLFDSDEEWKSSGSTSGGCARRSAPATATDRPWPSSSSTPTCLERQLPLLTLNRRDFADFAEHDGLVLLA